jgi:PAS domain S-box-containing protein
MVEKLGFLVELENQRSKIAERWHQQIALTSYGALDTEGTRQQLEHLVGQAISLLAAEAFDAAEAQEIGAALAQMHYIQPEGLGRSLGILGTEFAARLTPDQLPRILPNLARLNQEMSTGFLKQAYETMLAEQEAIRAALVSELEATESALRQSYAQLESRVEERTAELERANADLRQEIAQRARVEQALQQSEEKYRELVENINDVIYVVGRKGAIKYVSPSVEALLGYLPSELIGCTVTDFVYPPDREVFRDAFTLLLSGHAQQSEYRIVTKAGEVRCVRTSSRAVLVDGRMAEVHGVLSDVTERWQAEAALRENEARYRAVVEDQTELICRFRADGTQLFTNQAFERYLERLTNGSSDLDCLHLVFGDDKAEYDRIVGGLEPDQQVASFERRCTQSDGEVTWLQWTLRAAFDTAGQLLELQLVGRDITERKKAELALQESEERWRSLVENAPDYVVTVDSEGLILFMNYVIEGGEFPLEEVLGTRLVDYVIPEHRKRLEECIDRVLASGESEHVEAATDLAGDSRRWYATNIGGIRKNGEVAAALLITRDITERKRIDDIKDSLIRDVSHELRTPLAKAQMSLELLSELLDAERVDRERAQRVSYLGLLNIQRLLQTVEGMLDLTQLEAGVSPYQREQIRLDLLVHEVLQYMRPLADNKGLVLKTRVSAGLPEVTGDREKLFRVLLNLVDNAIKFSGEGEIVISARQDGMETLITVQDSGDGILPENIDRVFERFFQEKTRYEGVGVGLAICKAIVDAHGGRIWAESAGRGLGALVCFTLPSGNADTVGS